MVSCQNHWMLVVLLVIVHLSDIKEKEKRLGNKKEKETISAFQRTTLKGIKKKKINTSISHTYFTIPNLS